MDDPFNQSQPQTGWDVTGYKSHRLTCTVGLLLQGKHMSLIRHLSSVDVKQCLLTLQRKQRGEEVRAELADDNACWGGGGGGGGGQVDREALDHRVGSCVGRTGP